MAAEAENSVAPATGAAATRSARDAHGGGIDRSLLKALRNTSISVLYQDTALQYVWAENIPRGLSSRGLLGRSDVELFPGGEAERLSRAKREVLDGGDQQKLEIQFRENEFVRWFDIWIDADRGTDGTVKGVITTAVEITEQKRREQTLRALLREVSHRSKNLLAIIQSIATQTGRYSGTVGDFLAKFRGRLQSLAASQDLVTSSNWRGADLHELITGQVVRFCADPVRNIRIEGANPYLNPNAALHVGLALHELAVNSVRFGALSSAEGSITVSAHAGQTERGAVLVLTWRETGHSMPDLATSRRFGSVALEKVVPASINGSAELISDEGGITYRLEIPSGSFELG